MAGRWECWFWPRMAFAEPDVVLWLDGALVVVEAKYRSDRHDVAVDVTADPGRGDQLVRQYRSVTTSSGNRMPYAEPLEQAIRHCELVQVFLVNARRQRRARREWAESRGHLPPAATLRFVTWQWRAAGRRARTRPCGSPPRSTTSTVASVSASLPAASIGPKRLSGSGRGGCARPNSRRLASRPSRLRARLSGTATALRRHPIQLPHAVLLIRDF